MMLFIGFGFFTYRRLSSCHVSPPRHDISLSALLLALVLICVYYDIAAAFARDVDAWFGDLMILYRLACHW